MGSERATDIKGFFAAVFVFLTALWGWIGWAVVFLLMAMVVDYITGSLAARAAGEWSSAVARAGLRHKLGTVIAVGVAAFADLGVRVALNSDMIPEQLRGFEWPRGFTLVVTFWYFLTELGSILENAGKLGAPIHPWIRKGITVLKATITPEKELNPEDSAEALPEEAPDEIVRGRHEKPPDDDVKVYHGTQD